MYRHAQGGPISGAAPTIPPGVPQIRAVGSGSPVDVDHGNHITTPAPDHGRFTPPAARLLLGPGPSNAHPRVLAALSAPTIGHLDPAFIALMDEVRDLLRYAMQTRNRVTLPLPAPGSGGMEACIANLVEPGDRVVVCRNGVFGGRIADMVERCGGSVVALDVPWGEPVAPERLEALLAREGDVRLVAFVHAETSTGVLSDARALARIARAAGALTVMDAVTSLGGVEVYVDEWGVDAIFSGTQKCLSCPPGLSPVSFSERAMERIASRRNRVVSWLFDMNLITGYWDGAKRSYHHTAPIHAIYGLRESLALIAEEGLVAGWQRHRRAQHALIAGLETLGIQSVVADGYRLPQLTCVRVPGSVSDAEVRERLLTGFGIEIGGGLGDWAGKVWRIGLMGQGANLEPVTRLLSALARVIAPEGRRGNSAEGALAAAGDAWHEG
jgi:alanine-glyoxylate transaminase / serine-glyoxylate transaminase / serine-pyruvate transaminase